MTDWSVSDKLERIATTLEVIAKILEVIAKPPVKIGSQWVESKQVPPYPNFYPQLHLGAYASTTTGNLNETKD